VTVTDTSVGAGVAPDGTVSFTTTAAVNTGAGFTPATSCTLANPAATSKSCSVTYNAGTSTGATTITATYSGNGLSHASSGTSTSLDVLKRRTDGDDGTGGTVFVAGGAADAGSGFIETWWLVIQGNTGSYLGTGLAVGGAPEQGMFVPADGPHCIFPPEWGITDPDQYVTTTPPCTAPGTPDQTGHQQTSAGVGSVSMDE
jgi:hypothetical protein